MLITYPYRNNLSAYAPGVVGMEGRHARNGLAAVPMEGFGSQELAEVTNDFNATVRALTENPIALPVAFDDYGRLRLVAHHREDEDFLRLSVYSTSAAVHADLERAGPLFIIRHGASVIRFLDEHSERILFVSVDPASCLRPIEFPAGLPQYFATMPPPRRAPRREGAGDPHVPRLRPPVRAPARGARPGQGPARPLVRGLRGLRGHPGRYRALHTCAGRLRAPLGRIACAGAVGSFGYCAPGKAHFRRGCPRQASRPPCRGLGSRRPDQVAGRRGDPTRRAVLQALFRIGVGNRSFGQVSNLPQCLVSCPSVVRWALEGAAVVRRHGCAWPKGAWVRVRARVCATWALPAPLRPPTRRENQGPFGPKWHSGALSGVAVR